jgi:choice-of-anchor C domain-containing protein
MTCAALTCTAIWLAPALAWPLNMVANPGFEEPAIEGAVLGVAGGTIGAWIVGGNGVDLVRTAWQAAAGDQSLDLNRNSAGSVSQDLTTVAGQKYMISFALAGNPLGSGPKRVVVRWGGQTVGNFTFDQTGTSASQMGWVVRTVPSVIATGELTRLSFVSLTGSMSGSEGTGTFYGPAIDEVGVFLVPAPGAFVLLAMGVGGLLSLRRASRGP